MDKDVHFCKEFAAKEKKDCPALENVCRVYEKAMEEGLGKEDFSSSYKIVNK
jgi:3-hydroxyisobutyrate dehydrogenase